MAENGKVERSPKWGSDHFIIGGSLAVFVALLVLFLGFGAEDEPSTSTTDNSTVSLATPPASPSPTATATRSVAAEPAKKPKKAPSEVAVPDNDTLWLASHLAVVANEYGYGPADESFADVIVIAVCEPVEAGELTWEDSVIQDITDGAPASDAEAFNDYARTVFCPGMGYDVG